MKKLRILLAAAMLLGLLSACGGTSEPAPAPQPGPAPEQTGEETTWTGVLYADFSDGNPEGEYIKEFPFEYTGEQKSAGELADELSVLTGLDFIISALETEDGLVVEWGNDSTLIAGLDDREQKEEFFFFDANTLRWFMMDSLWRTLTDNLGVENIYYTMEGDQELVFEELYPVAVFPRDIPYMGSPFYYAHSDVRGEETFNTVGLWRLDGSMDTASIEIDELGNFTTYYASGAIESIGYLECVDEYGDGIYRYDMYTMEGEWISGFYFDSEDQFHMGNGDGPIYIRDEQW